MELMVVVIVVAILSALAVPSMIRARDDRHAYNNSMQVGQLLRGARLRAIGRGGAVAVSMTSNSTTDRGTFKVYESVTVNAVPGSTPTPGPTNRTPYASCLTSDWTPPAGAFSGSSNALPLDSFDYNFNLDVTMDFQTTITLNWVNRLGTASNTAQTAAWLCFTPAGRTYVSASASPSFNAGDTFIDLDICMSRGGPCGSGIGPQRHILVPPAGVARLFSR
jgi:type II secretory pathway pseudopilin PulG